MPSIPNCFGVLQPSGICDAFVQMSLVFPFSKTLRSIRTNRVENQMSTSLGFTCTTHVITVRLVHGFTPHTIVPDINLVPGLQPASLALCSFALVSGKSVNNNCKDRNHRIGDYLGVFGLGLRAFFFTVFTHARITAVLSSVVVQAPGVNNMYFFTYCFVTEITRSILSQILRKWAHYNPRNEENKLFKNLSNIWRFEKSDFLGSTDCK
jgi:hypothetical protein